MEYSAINRASITHPVSLRNHRRKRDRKTQELEVRTGEEDASKKPVSSEHEALHS